MTQGTHAKPQLSFWQIWNMCFGFLGIQFGFALQNANASRIFETLGADLGTIPLLWIAAPLTGLIVQPIVGYWSDRTWTRFGRRRPYFLAGAVLATLALLVFPNSPALWVAAGMLWVLDASLNLTMEPFRAYVGDQLPPGQRPLGFAMQGFFIGLGAVIASMLPWLLTHLGVSNVAGVGEVPDSVRYAFYILGAGLFLAVGWTVVSTREYPPEQLDAFDTAPPLPERRHDPAGLRRKGGAFLGMGIALLALVAVMGWARELYLLGAGLGVYGLSLFWLAGHGPRGMVSTIMADLHGMPDAMRRLAWVQFFSWFGLFCMWIYSTAAVTGRHYGASEAGSALYNEGANWVGVLFGAYNGFAMLAALLIPAMVRAIGLPRSHLVNLVLGGLGLASFAVVRDPQWLLLSMVGVGFAWASILSLPYAMLADSLPARKMGVYMGIFNFFIVIPQLIAAATLGAILHGLLGGEPIRVLVLGGASMIVAGLCVLRVREPAPAARPVPVARP
jgi:maltose/moltooligosaccharide transporter